MKLHELQKKMVDKKIDSYLINHSNMFVKQDILDDENKILELTGFSGSNGILLVFQNKAILFVDGRYEIQSKQEVSNKNIEIVCTKLYPLSGIIAPYLRGKAKNLMCNHWCFTENVLRHMQNALNGINILFDEENLLGHLVTKKVAKVFDHDIKFSGADTNQKIQILLKKMEQFKLKYYVMCDAASVSWLLNKRSDILPNTPILRAFVVVKDDGTYTVFSENLQGIDYKNLAEFEKYLEEIKSERVGFDSQYTPKKVLNILGKNAVNVQNPIVAAKSKKSDVEMSGFENAHLRDGVALTKFLCWLDKNWQNKTELDICEKLLAFRKKQENFYSNSFDTIAAFGENAAIVHYSPSKKTNKKLESGNVLLLDSGAQYFDGTTDVTRTIAIGNVISSDICKHFTLVLKAHIALSSSIIPLGEPDKLIDAVARRELWKYGLEYKHGTGHGVGHFSCVHEMPPSLSDSGAGEFCENMVLSIEPGYYLENKFGIRIENLVKTILISEPPFDGKFIKFEPLTLAPIDKRLINKYLLSEDEQSWLNSYHEKVFEKLSPFMDKSENRWLKEMCSPL